MGEPITKERLANYIKLKAEVERYLERIAQMKSAEQFAPKGESDGSQHTPSASDRMANAILRRMNYQEKMAPLINKNLDEMEIIDAAINELDDPMERDVLRLRYTEHAEESPYKHPAWNVVAMQIYRGDEEKHLQAVYRLHGKALQNIRNTTPVE